MQNENVLYFPESLSVPSVLKVLDSPKPIKILFGWRSGGKSTSLANILLTKLLVEKHFRCAHIRKHYNELNNSTFQTLSDGVNKLGYNNHVNIVKDHFRFENIRRPSNYMFGAGSDKPDKIRSTPNLNAVWFEEFHDATQNDFESIYGTIRAMKGIPTEFIATLNNDKVPVDGFLHNTFFKDTSPIWNDIELIHVSWRDNQFIDQKQTEQVLKLAVLNDEERFNILDKGGFIPEIQGEYYPHFNNYCIVEGSEPDRNYPLLISFDFNYKPCSLVIGQNILRKGGGLHFFKELQIDGGTLPLVNELKAYLTSINWTGSYKITGDASGHKHDTRSGSITDFQIIQNELKVPQSWMNYKNKTNMSLGMSRDLIDMAFNEQIIKINKKGCPLLINDIRIAKPEDDGSFKKDRNMYKMDLLDAFRYAVHEEIKNVTDIYVKKAIYQ